jgi:hypothetical protein
MWNVEIYVWLVFWELEHGSGTSDIALGNTRKFWEKNVISMLYFLSSMLQCQKEVCRCSMVACSYGLHHNIAQMQGNVLLNAVYRIKTQLGISDASYSHSDEFQVFGTGQDSSSSPSIWILLWSTGFDIFDDHCYGATYTSPDLTKVLKLGMTRFVDDNNNQTISQPGKSETALALCCTHDAQLIGHDISWASGGALETSKCSYQSVRLSFSSDVTWIFLFLKLRRVQPDEIVASIATQCVLELKAF